MFEFKVTENAGELDITLKGRLDATVAPQLHEELAKMEGGVNTDEASLAWPHSPPALRPSS